MGTCYTCKFSDPTLLDQKSWGHDLASHVLMSPLNNSGMCSSLRTTSLDVWKLFFFFAATPVAYGSSQARVLNQSCSCWPMPQPWQHQTWAASMTLASARGNAGSLTHWVKPGIEPASSQRLRLVLNLLSHNGNAWKFIYLFPFLRPHLWHMARGRIRAAAASLRHSNTGSEPCLWPTPQLRATLDP